MAKITLDNITNLQNETTVVGTINNNNQKIEEAIEKTLSRDGTLPNNMAATLDMNSNRIINLPNAIEDSEPVTLGQLQEIENITANTFITAELEPSVPQSRVLTPGTNISVEDLGAQNSFIISVSDAELNAIAQAGSSSDTVPYYTSEGQASITAFKPYARLLVSSEDSEAARDTLGLDQVDNTSDADKPISIATQEALDDITSDIGDLGSDKADKTITISAGTGLTGGGDLSANRTISLNSGSQASLALADTAVQPARKVDAGTGLEGGGDLSADRTIQLNAASIASLALADTATQPEDLSDVATSGSYNDLDDLPTLGDLAAKDKITVPTDIDYTGTPDGTKFLRDDGEFVSIPGGGDMLAANNLSDLDNPAEGLKNIGGIQPHLFGLTLSNNVSDPDNDIDIAPGQASAIDLSAILKLPVAITKRLDASWAAGSGNGGLDTGSVSTDKWYHVHLIGNVTTGDVDALFSLSPTAPTLPSGWTAFRRLGAVCVDGASKIVPFTQSGNEFLWKTMANNVIANNPGTSATLSTLSVPSGVQVWAILSVFVQNTASVRIAALVTSPDQDDSAVAAGTNSTTVTNSDSNAGASQIQTTVRTNTSSQVRWRLDKSGAGVSFFITTVGWIDPL